MILYKDLRIVFMGTPEFSVASLEVLVNEGCNIVAVITAPDKPAGRGMQMQQSAVKQYALSKHLKILQPEKLKNKDFIDQLKELKADLQIVVAFRMLPEIVWNMPPLGTINLHGSLLPQYRGAAPINWAIINGEKQTGVTTFLLQHEIDTGNILLQEDFAIEETDDAGSIHDKMKKIGAAVLLKTVKAIASGTLKAKPQLTDNNRALQHAPKIFTETCLINFNKPANEVFNLIRGLSPYPAASTILNNKKLKIYKAAIIKTQPQIPSGQWQSDKKNFLYFSCSNGYISVLELQLEGKKKMKIDEFLRGYRFE